MHGAEGNCLCSSGNHMKVSGSFLSSTNWNYWWIILQLDHWGEKDPKTLVWITHTSPMSIERVTLTKVFHAQWPPSPTHLPGCCSLFHFMAQLLLLLQGPFLGIYGSQNYLPPEVKPEPNYHILCASLACCRSSIEQHCWRKLSSFQSYGLLQTRYQEIRWIGAHALWHGNKVTRISEMAVTALWHHIELLTYTAGNYIYKFTYSGIVIIYSGIFSESMASW
jgi:hypothetical protein